MNKSIQYYYSPYNNETVYKYQNVNKDMTLRNNVTNFFLKKISKWILKYSKFKILSSKNINYDIIYKILRKIVKKTNLNWYELRSNSSKLKKYFLKYF